jgi:hypothetical protein
MLLAYQGLPIISGPLNIAVWQPIYAVVSSIDPNDPDYQHSCNTEYNEFQLITCSTGNLLCTFSNTLAVNCPNCLLPDNSNLIDFCYHLSSPCLVGILNVTQGTQYVHNCYIEVFFVGTWDGQLAPPPIYNDPYPNVKSVVIASLRWSATGQFMKATNGVMLNCTNHTT